MNYLTRIAVDHQTAAPHGYAWHQSLWKTFPGKEHRDFLFRVEPRKNGLLLYLLSETEPVIPNWGQWETKPVSASFLEHTVYRFWNARRKM